MKLRRVVVIATLAVMLALFLLYAPVVPFERLEDVQAPSNASACSTPAATQCFASLSFKLMWVRSYGSFTYDAFGVGTTPFASPVTITINGMTTIFTFNGTELEERVAYPTFANREPVPLIEIGSTSISSAPFGGTVLSIGFLNVGRNETVQLDVGVAESATPRRLEVSAGESAVLNFTSWTIAPPRFGDSVKLTLSGNICYGKVCLFYQRSTVTRVASVSK